MDFQHSSPSRPRRPSPARRSAPARRGNPETTTHHLLLALTDERDSVADVLLRASEADTARIAAPARRRCRQAADACAASRSPHPQPRSASAACSSARAPRRAALGDSFTATEHLLLGLARDARRRARVACARRRRQGDAARRPARPARRPVGLLADAEERYGALAKFGRDLTTLAEAGKLDPVIGRDDEVRRVIQVLSRRTKNNPVLIGEPGVGKTAIVEGLAQRIVARRRARGPQGQARVGARPRLAARRRQVPRRVRGAAEGRARRHRARPTARSSSSSTSCTRSSAPARPRAPSTPPTC